MLKPNQDKAPAAPHPFFEHADTLLALQSAHEDTLALQRLQLLRELLSEGPHALRRAKRDRRLTAFDDMLFNLHQRLAADGDAALAAVAAQALPGRADRRIPGHRPAAVRASSDRIYGDSAAPLFLVGDPKQAIYSFRNADLHTYLHARGDALAEYTLTENQRSTRELLQALNGLFGANARAFVLPGLDYRSVAYGAKPRKLLLDRSTPARTALQLWSLPRDAAGEPLPKKAASQAALQACAGEIARLLAAARRGVITLGERPLSAGDIAVLVRSHAHGGAMRRALAQLGVGSVELSQASVFDSPDAADLERLLAAILEPAREPLLRAALATEAMGLDAAAILALSADETALLDLIARFAGYRDTWLQRGVGLMLRQWMQTEGVSRRLLARPDGERRLTNLLHLAELPARGRRHTRGTRSAATLAAEATQRNTAGRRGATAPGIRPRPGAGGDDPQVQGPRVPAGLLSDAVGRPAAARSQRRRAGVPRRDGRRGDRFPNARQGAARAAPRADRAGKRAPRRCA